MSFDKISNPFWICFAIISQTPSNRFIYKKFFLTTLKVILCEAVQVKARSIYPIAYVYHRLYFINDKLSKIKLANKKHALAFISNKISRIFFSVLAKKVSIQIKEEYILN